MKRVRAAGGAVWRRTADGRLEVLVVHRPRYDDWSLPKGKAEGAENDEECAAREVEEETGYRCVMGPELPSIEYTDRFDRPKIVRYWSMEAVEPPGERSASAEEIDDVAWMAIEAARDRVSYAHDADVLAALLTLGHGPRARD